jgi:hypothetical protein
MLDFLPASHLTLELLSTFSSLLRLRVAVLEELLHSQVR